MIDENEPVEEPRRRIVTPVMPIYNGNGHHDRINKIIWAVLAGAVGLLTAIVLIAYGGIRDDARQLEATARARGETLSALSAKVDSTESWRKSVDGKLDSIESSIVEIKVILAEQRGRSASRRAAGASSSP